MGRGWNRGWNTTRNWGGNFRRSVVYGLSTLNVARKYWLNKMGIRKYPIFRKRLAGVLSPEYKARIFGVTSNE